MPKSPSHTSSERAVSQFLRYSQLGKELGIRSQLIGDEKFRGDIMELRGRDVANFGLCSYLGLTDDTRLVDAAIDAVTRYGNSYSSSIAYSALPLYGQLRERLEEMLGAPVVMAPSTTLAHMSALPVLVRRGDTVVIDAMAHASLLAVIPSLEANGATIHRLPHSDLERLSDIAGSVSGRTWYLFDGLYSMHGVTAPAEGLRKMLDQHPDLWLYCDDAHSFGWSGRYGRGQFLERAGWHDRIVMSFGLSKSFGVLGGVVATLDRDLTELIELTGGPLVFGGPIPPPALGAGVASADIHLSGDLPGLQADLMERIRFVNDFSADIGLPLSAEDETPLWFVEMGPVLTTISVANTMLKRGFFLNPAAFPVVPRNRGGMRFTVTRYNSIDQIEEMLTALNEVRQVHEGTDAVVDLTAFEDESSGSRSES